MSDLRAQAEALIAAGEAATKGPWNVDAVSRGVRHLERNCDWYSEDVPVGEFVPGRNGGDGGTSDGIFIALARNAAPAIRASVFGGAGGAGEGEVFGVPWDRVQSARRLRLPGSRPQVHRLPGLRRHRQAAHRRERGR